MQAVRRRPYHCCILCTFTSTGAFSTSSSNNRYTPSRKSPHSFAQETRRSHLFDDRNVDAALLGDRWDRLDNRGRDGSTSKDSYSFWKAGIDGRESRAPSDRDDRRYIGRATWRPRIDGLGGPGQSLGNQTNDEKKFKRSGEKPKKDFATYEEALDAALQELGKVYRKDIIFTRLHLTHKEMNVAFESWDKSLKKCIAKGQSSDPDFQRLKKLWPSCRNDIFRLYVKYAFYARCVPAKFNRIDREDQEDLANLRYPTEWFPATRGFPREFHLHVGPTNSGKTYHALKRLEQADTGLYAGPLRLLAHEVYMRLNAAGSRCNLITGDERRAADGDPSAPMTSCTVEMVPLNAKLDVAVIDEIQMIGSEERGWAWTQAVLGIMAKEVHCCGEERAVPIMQELVALCGEKLHIHRYERLSPLQMSHESLEGDLRKLRKGDCVVAFKVMDIHALRQLIEKKLQVKVAVIYGSLPPETRAQQAKLFNDPDSGYDILVASNAIGMGLNLSIKRLIFQTSQKFNGTKWSTLSIAETKQIAGRAGRYSTAEQDMKKVVASNLDINAEVQSENHSTGARSRPKASVGYVTTLERFDFPIIEKLMNVEPEPIKSAGIQPPTYVIERFAKYFPPTTPFAYLLIRLNEITETSSRFYICDLRTHLAIADAIESVEGLTVTDRLIFCASPIEPRKPGEPELARAYARLVAENKAASIIDVPELDLDLLEDDYIANRGYLAKLENLHKGVIIWNWLSFRFAGVFINRELSQHVKELVEARIEEVLQQLSFDYDKIRKAREQAVIELLTQEKDNKEEGDQEAICAEGKELDVDVSDEYSNGPQGKGEQLDELLEAATSEGGILSPDKSQPRADVFEESLLSESDLNAVQPDDGSEHATTPVKEESYTDANQFVANGTLPMSFHDIDSAAKEHRAASSASQ